MAGFGRHFYFAVVLCMVIITVCAQPSTTLTDRVSSLYQPFGVQDDTIITDGQMTASTQLNGSEAFRGRLNGDGAWQPSGQGTDQFLAVDLLYARYIFGIQTQGQGDGYIETYRVIYQRDITSSLILYSEGGGSAKTIFTGNSDNETIVQNNFTPYIYARYILVNPQTFSGAPRLRVELLGVDELPITSFSTTTPSWTTTQSAVTTTTSTTPLVTSSTTTTSSRTTEAGTASQGPSSNTAVTGQSDNVVASAVGGGVAAFLILIGVAVILFMRRRKKKRTRTPSVEETSQNVTGYVNTSFVDVAEQTRHHARDDTDAASGAAGNNEVRIPISPPQHIPLKILLTDYNRELTWEDISLTSNLLGAGHFGEVRKGTVMVDGERIPSAIKILKRGADDTSKQDFQQEVNIMRHVGYHPNIINLLGFCIYQGQQYMALEMAGNGDLLKFLRNSRMQEVVTPTYANSRSDFNGRTLSTLSPVQLLRIACDVATGMGHLSAKEVIHRDLAARNVLLTDNLIAKVADFGLSRGEGIYEQTSKRAIPFRSTAIEALTRRIYTTKSDIWSFGILLWEIVTIGGTP